jgi:hypothetical protein
MGDVVAGHGALFGNFANTGHFGTFSIFQVVRGYSTGGEKSTHFIGLDMPENARYSPLMATHVKSIAIRLCLPLLA